MKKLLTLTLTVALVLSLTVLLAGCGEEKEPYEGYDLTEYITLPDYDSFETKVPDVNITDDDVDAEIKARLEAAAETTEVDEGTVAEGDTIHVSYNGTLEDGSSPAGMNSEGSTLTLGEGKMIPGFESGLYGATIGVPVTLELTFPDPYKVDESLSGKPVTFVVTVLSKDVKNVPEFNEEFIKKTSSYTTEEEYRTALAKELEQQEYENQLDEFKEAIYVKLADETEVIKYPEDKVKDQEKEMDENYRTSVETYGYEWEDFLEANDMDQDAYDEMIHGYAQEFVKQEMMIYLIAQRENITVSDEEVDEALADLLATSGYGDEDAFEDAIGMSLDEYGESINIKRSLLMTKELDVIYERLSDKIE